MQFEIGGRGGNGSGGQACNMKWGEGSTENVEKGPHMTALMSPPTYQRGGFSVIFVATLQVRGTQGMAM